VANGHPAPYPVDYFDIGNEEDFLGQNNWRSGNCVSVGGHTTTLKDPNDDKNNSIAMYAFGGITEFTKQATIGFAETDLTSALSKGTANQQFYAAYPPVVAGTNIVYIGNATDTTNDEQWTEGTTFTYCLRSWSG
jgi:alpha-N-arabinofuranosidase